MIIIIIIIITIIIIIIIRANKDRQTAGQKGSA